MERFSINELMVLTRDELCELSTNIEHALKYLEAGSTARTIAIESINRIRRVMVKRGFYY